MQEDDNSAELFDSATAAADAPAAGAANANGGRMKTSARSVAVAFSDTAILSGGRRKLSARLSPDAMPWRLCRPAAANRCVIKYRRLSAPAPALTVSPLIALMKDQVDALLQNKAFLMRRF